MASASAIPNVENVNNSRRSSICSRLRASLGLKLLLTVVLNLVVFIPYRFFQHHHFFPITVMPTSFVDRSLPFLDWTVVIYLSIYLLVPVGPFLMRDRKQIL